MGFVAQVYSLFRKLTDVNWASVTSSAPFLKWDSATDKIVGAPPPVTNVGAGEAGRVVTGNADGSLAASATVSVDGFGGFTAARAAHITSDTNRYDQPALKIKSMGYFAPILDGQNEAGQTVFSVNNSGGVTAAALYADAFRPSSLYSSFQVGAYGSVAWRTGTGFYDPIVTQLSAANVGYGLLSVTDADGNAGAVIQGAVVIDTPNFESVTGQGNVYQRIRALDRYGNLHGYVPIYAVPYNASETNLFNPHVLSAPADAPADADILAGQAAVYLDEAAGKLKFRVRTSSGSYKTGEVSLQ